MKDVKISDFRIPLIIIAFSSLMILVAIFIDNEIMAAVAGFAIAISLVLLIFVYYPIIIMKLFKGKIDHPERFVKNTGILSVSFIILGIFFKLMHWPGAAPIIIFGSTIFSFSYIPVWFAHEYRTSDWFQRILYFSFSNSLGWLVIAYEFKTMHWPGADFATNISLYSNLFLFLPLVIYTLLFKRSKNYFQLDNKFLFGFMIAFIISSVISFRMSFSRMASDNNNFNSIDKNLKIYEKRSLFLYEALAQNKSSDSTYISEKNKILALKGLADSCDGYLKNLKNYLVLQTEDELDSSKVDSITFDNIVQKANYDIPSSILIGEDSQHPRTGKFSALEMKSKLLSFIKKLDSLAPEDFRLQLKQTNPFDFSDVVIDSANNVVDKWEVLNFHHETLAKDYTIITGFQANIRFMEMTLLNELFTRANSNTKNNMAAQLAELATKYESEKQEKKIAMLQKDQQLNEIRMESTKQELESSKNKILLFTFGSALVGILLIFVVRSNILRKRANKELAQQKELILEQKVEVENQKHLVEEKQKEIVDSINYAKRLQEAILARPEEIDRWFPENFLLYQPKDIVAGDFYFFEVSDTHIFYAAADCTGHGVPGAMVSIVCSNALSRCVKEFKLTDPGKILDKTRDLVLETFSKSNSEVKDGMDISLMVFEKASRLISWSGANNPLWYITNKQLHEIKPNKQPIGKTDNPLPFTTHIVPVLGETIIYLFTDGFADQFGGPKGKKFKYKQLEESALDTCMLPIKDQKEVLWSRFLNWKGKLEQIDDVCLIAIKIS